MPGTDLKINGKIYRALEDYQSQDVEELAIPANSLLKECDDGWYRIFDPVPVELTDLGRVSIQWILTNARFFVQEMPATPIALSPAGSAASVGAAVQSFIDYVDSDAYNPDVPTFREQIFTAAVSMIFGPEVWNWIDAKTVEARARLAVEETEI